jgi:hypothetical protein
MLGAFALALGLSAWLCDDAYITLRTVANFCHGLGLTWNPDERVQTYTHPLWMLALGDPLLARLPPYPGQDMIAGHFARRIPPGYFDTLKTGQDRLRSPELASYYDRLALLGRGPLWSGPRWRAIVGMALHLYDRDRDAYLNSAAARAPVKRVSFIPAAEVNRSGGEVKVEAPDHAAGVGLWPRVHHHLHLSHPLQRRLFL